MPCGTFRFSTYSPVYPLWTLRNFCITQGYDFPNLRTPNIIICILLCYNLHTLKLFAHTLGLKYPRLRNPCFRVCIGIKWSLYTGLVVCSDNGSVHVAAAATAWAAATWAATWAATPQPGLWRWRRVHGEIRGHSKMTSRKLNFLIPFALCQACVGPKNKKYQK